LEKIRIIVDEKTLELAKVQLESGKIYERISGVLYVQLGDLCFPDSKWNDLCASILAMWLLSVNKHLLCQEKKTTLYFMDGAYSINLTYQNRCQSLMQFMNPNGLCVLEAEMDIQYFARQLLAASACITHHFSQYQENRSIQELSKLENTLRTTLRKSHTLERM